MTKKSKKKFYNEPTIGHKCVTINGWVAIFNKEKMDFQKKNHWMCVLTWYFLSRGSTDKNILAFIPKSLILLWQFMVGYDYYDEWISKYRHMLSEKKVTELVFINFLLLSNTGLFKIDSSHFFVKLFRF